MDLEKERPVSAAIMHGEVFLSAKDVYRILAELAEEADQTNKSAGDLIREIRGYLGSFRNAGVFHEGVVTRICPASGRSGCHSRIGVAGAAPR